ncbi:hypothetical protein BMS3Abin12_01008 [bacterium BMS3Abin12]|nr:hypothetical protein BMS3Abin12_01008 [bacterium BMS3Abin12]
MPRLQGHAAPGAPRTPARQRETLALREEAPARLQRVRRRTAPTSDEGQVATEGGRERRGQPEDVGTAAAPQIDADRRKSHRCGTVQAIPPEKSGAGHPHVCERGEPREQHA